LALWRYGRGWSEKELESYITSLQDRAVNFEAPPDEMVETTGWTVDGGEGVLGKEPPGPPIEDGLFLRAKQGLINYDFSDPRIVEGHFDPKDAFVGRNVLLELKVLGLHYLCGCRVHSVRDVTADDRTIFGFRYDTLDGHIEKGYEWFLLTKDHATGEVFFKIEAHWQLGSFPNWWSKLGFVLIGQWYRRRWRDNAPKRLLEVAKHPVAEPTAEPGQLAHRGDPKPKLTQPN
jgi:uncharacterized protein (UPF0548 family)